MVASDHMGVSFGYFGAMAWYVLPRDPDPKPDRCGRRADLDSSSRLHAPLARAPAGTTLSPAIHASLTPPSLSPLDDDSLVLSCIGAAYGTAQAGLGLCRAGTRDPNMIIKGIIPVAMAGVRGIYGLVLSIIIMSGIKPDGGYTQYNGYMHLGAGLCCGAAQFASGIAVGVVGESGTQAVTRQAKLFAPVVLILIFTEALALYGLIVGMIMAQSGQRRVGD